MRTGSAQVQTQMLRLSAAIEHCGEHLFGKYVVVEMRRFRIRGL